MLKPPNYRGKLIVVEGIDGSGKSTQIDLLYKSLKAGTRTVFFTEWNSSELVKSTTKKGKKKKLLTPTTFSLLQGTDFAERWENNMLPMLKAGAIVLADRYAYTAFARDVARGVDAQWVRNLYAFAPQPDLVFYFRVPLDISLDRILAGRSRIKFYEAGMDLGLSENRLVSFRLFQQRIANEYEEMIDEFGFTVIDGTLPVEEQQKILRKIVQKNLRGWKGLPNPLRPPRRRRTSQKKPPTNQTQGGKK